MPFMSVPTIVPAIVMPIMMIGGVPVIVMMIVMSYP